MPLSEDARQAREYWDRHSDAYQAEHASQLNTKPCAWGIWAAPEDEIHALGEVAGRDILEFGCGAAQWSICLAQRGARPVGLDNSDRQLAHARRLMAEAGVDFPLIHASAEDTGLPDASFDIVFCDHGAMTFGNPERTVPEAARLLRPGGLLVFNLSTPLMTMCWPEDAPEADDRLHLGYFELGRLEYDSLPEYVLTYGEWIRLLRRHGFIVEDLIELRPTEGATSTYAGRSYEWGRRWPTDNIWKARKGRG